MLVTGNEIVNFSNMEILCTYAPMRCDILLLHSLADHIYSIGRKYVNSFQINEANCELSRTALFTNNFFRLILYLKWINNFLSKKSLWNNTFFHFLAYTQWNYHVPKQKTAIQILKRFWPILVAKNQQVESLEQHERIEYIIFYTDSILKKFIASNTKSWK